MSMVVMQIYQLGPTQAEGIYLFQCFNALRCSVYP